MLDLNIQMAPPATVETVEENAASEDVAKPESGDPSAKFSVEQPISRNAPCPCGSGKKYKHCHGKLV